LSDEEPQIKVFASDDNLKALGELLSNDSSRSIIYNLMTKEMYTNEISTKLDMRVSLVIHHLKKLEELGLLEITEKKIKRKGIDHRFFKIRSNIFVVVDNTKEEIIEKGFLKKIFRDGIKLSAVTIMGLMSWLSFKIFRPVSDDLIYYQFSSENPSFDVIDFNYYFPIILSNIIVIVLTLVILKKRKRN